MRTHIDLFSGIGGFSIAAESCGLQTIAFAEIDPFACKVLKKHWPNVPNFGDVNNVTGISAWLLTGGPPCQPVSIAGERKGAADDRWLWPATIAAIERTQPTFCLLENPVGIIDYDNGLEFERVLSELDRINYHVQPIVIPACAIGAFQHRKRLWICAHSKRQGLSRCQQNNGAPSSARAAHAVANNGMPSSWNALARHSRGLRGSDGISVSMVRREVKCYGNAIVPQVAARIIRAMIEAEEKLL